MSCVKQLALAPQSFLHLMSCRNLLGPGERRSTFPDGLETESGIPCIDPAGSGWFDRVAQQSPAHSANKQRPCLDLDSRSDVDLLSCRS